MKVQYPCVARQCFNAYGRRYCCPNREQRIKLPLIGTHYTPKVGGTICVKCSYHIKTIYIGGTEYVCCKWWSQTERRAYEKTIEG